MNANPSVSFVVELTSLVHRCANNDTKRRLLNPRYPPKPTHAPSSRTPSLHRSQDCGPQRGRSKSKRRGPNSTPKELDFPTRSTSPPSHQPSANPIHGKLGTGSFL
ncbi:hypothetical protein MTO96_048163 [Rhipicephalus appendiculatus]